MTVESVSDSLELVRERKCRSSHHQRQMTEQQLHENSSEKENSDIMSSNEAVALSLVRGRAVLADAEAHLCLFNEFVHHQQDSKIVQSFPLFEAEAKAFEATLSVNDVKGASLLMSPSPMGQRSSFLLSAEYIENRAKSGDPIDTSEIRNSYKNCDEYDSLKLLKYRSLKRFDPSKLNVTRRASMSDSVRKKYISDDNKDPYHFKALPLPGGKKVKSDIFAMTKAVTGKKAKKLNNIYDPELDAGKKMTYQRESKKRVPYERFTSKELSMLQYFNSSNHIESDVSLNESSSLRRDITRLELLLRRAKEIYTHKIKRLDDYNAISLDEMFLKYIDLDDEVGSICSTFSDASNSTYHSQASLYERQQRWLIARRRKQVLARQKYEEDALDGITGKPELDATKSSWIKAKEEHALNVTHFMEEEQRRMEEKGLKVTYSDKMITESIDGSILREIDMLDKKRMTSKALQASLDKLSKPRKMFKQEGEREKSNLKLDEEPLIEKDKPGVALGKTCFSALSDKQFSEMMKSLGIGKLLRKKNKTSVGFDKEKVDVGSEKENAMFKCYSSSPTLTREKNESVCLVNSNPIFRNCRNVARPSSKRGDFRESAIANACSAISAAELALNGETEKILDDQTSFLMMPDASEVIDRIVQPYQRYEAGRVQFFDRSSSSEQGRFRVRDARDYAPESMRRIPDSEEGVVLLVGKKKGDKDGDISGNVLQEVVITLVFDRSLFNEHSASVWWRLHRHRFIDREQQL